MEVEKIETENAPKLPVPDQKVAAPIPAPPQASPSDPKQGSDGTSELKEAVAESQKIIQSAKPQAPKIKRGRGRPRKDGTIPGAVPTQGSASSVTPPATQPPPDISKHIATPLIAISKIPAAKFRIPELALSPDEAQSCAEALQGVLNAFVPDVATMNPKTAAVIGALVVFGSIGLQKVQIYNMRIAEVMAEMQARDQEIVNSANNSPNSGVIPAQNYFSKQ